MNGNSRSSQGLLPAWINGIWGAIGLGSILYVLVYLLWLYFRWGGEENVTLIGDLFSLPMDLIVAIAAWTVFSKKDLKLPVRRMWLFIGLGFASYLIADSIWTYLEYVLEIPPFPAASDIFYLLFPPLTAIGLFTFSNTLINRGERWRFVSDLLIVLITASMLMWYFIIQPTAIANAGDFLPQLIAVAYPITDVVLIGGIISALLRKPDRDASSALWLLFLGMLFFVGADILFAYASLAGTYVTGTWIDSGWLISPMVFLFAAIRHMYKDPTELQDSPWHIRLDGFIHSLPNVSVVVGSLVTVSVVALNFDPKAGWLLGGAGLCIVLLVLRQFEEFSFRTKFIAIFSLSSIAIAFTIGVYYYNTQADRALQEFRRLAKTSISIASLQQNGDEFEKISSAQDPLYEKFRIQNLKIRSSDPYFIFFYTMRKDSQGIYFVVDAGEPGEPNISQYGERYTDPSPTLSDNFDTMNEALADPDIYTDEYGSFLSAYTPIFSSDGRRVGVVAVDIDANTIVNTQRRLFTQTMLIVLLAGLASVLIGVIVGNLLVNPIIRLTSDTNKYTEGDFSFRTDVKTNDEVGKLGLAFNATVDRIQEMVSSLEIKVSDRTAELESANRQILRRSKQFEAIAQVARSISSTQNFDILLSQVTNLISREFGFYHVGVFLLDLRKEYAVLSAANSDGGQRMLERNHRLRVGETGIVGYVTSTGKARVALDTGTDAMFFNNPDLPETRSEIALPLHIGDEIIGALDVQSTEPNAFNEDDISILGTLADQVSVAIQNTRQYETTRKALIESETLSRQFVQRGWQKFTKTENVLGIRHSGAKATLLYGRKTKKGKSDTNASNREQPRANAKGASLSLPIKLRGEVIGSVAVRSTANRQFDQDELDIVSAIIERAAIAMENARLLAESQKRAAKERTIGEIAAKISAQNNIDELLKTTVQELNRTLPGTEIAVQLINEQETE